MIVMSSWEIAPFIVSIRPSLSQTILLALNFSLILILLLLISVSMVNLFHPCTFYILSRYICSTFPVGSIWLVFFLFLFNVTIYAFYLGHLDYFGFMWLLIWLHSCLSSCYLFFISPICSLFLNPSFYTFLWINWAFYNNFILSLLLVSLFCFVILVVALGFVVYISI